MRFFRTPNSIYNYLLTKPCIKCIFNFQSLFIPSKSLTTSRTLDSFVDLQSVKSNTPSSSGYGSQAVSSTNLTSNDSSSVASINIDGTPDMEIQYYVENKTHERLKFSSSDENIDRCVEVTSICNDKTKTPQKLKITTDVSEIKKIRDRRNTDKVLHKKRSSPVINNFLQSEINHYNSSTIPQEKVILLKFHYYIVNLKYSRFQNF